MGIGGGGGVDGSCGGGTTATHALQKTKFRFGMNTKFREFP
jgi:hypothetical protein